MNPSDSAEFERILVTLFATMGRDEPTTDVIRVWWGATADLSLDQFSRACGKYLATETRHPVPARIRELAGANNHGWPSPEAAWNAIPKNEDEAAWMCQEMAAAMGACQDSLARGDMIAARMAFLEVYRQEIAGKEGKPKWWISESSCGDYESRLNAKLDLLRQHPDRLPGMLWKTQFQLEAMTGSKRSEEMQAVASINQARKLLQSSSSSQAIGAANE